MPFTLKNSDKNEMIAILSTWEQSFQQKTKDPAKKARMQKALSIAIQMQVTLDRHTHAHLWIAKHAETDAPMAMMIVDDTGHKEKTIRFLLSNQKNPEARGSGRFLVEKLTQQAAPKGVKIKTTSENADNFWRKCPGFKPSPDNSGDYVCEPSLPGAIAGLGSASFFQEEQKASESKLRKHRR
jgi:hypothetical protein